MQKFLFFLAVYLLHSFSVVKAQTTSSFENLGLPLDSYWNGFDMSGGFQSGNAFFVNYYDTAWGGSWAGWSYSSMRDSTTAGFLNQYSAITATGYNSDTYATAFVSFYSGATYISLSQLARGKVVTGFYITNNTYSYLSMLNGDAVSKKFGGATGDDPDFFRLKIVGYLNGIQQDTTDFYLADYRFSDHSLDYIVNDWQFVDLSVLGSVDSLVFQLSSSDNGIWGMNTPSYFCLDNFVTSDGVGFDFNLQSPLLTFYPNPAQDFLMVESSDIFTSIQIFDLTGKLVLNLSPINSRFEKIDLTGLNSGVFLLKCKSDSKLSLQKFIKN